MIRDFEPQDMEAVLGIWLEASIQAHAFVDRGFWEASLPAMRQTYIPASETYVHAEADRVTAFMCLDGDTLAALFVDPAHQRCGIGERLLAKAKALHNRLTLTVYKENLQAVRFYLANGFTIIGEQRDEHTGHPELRMTLTP
ncbi:GNAT family N-acetyltransferase [Arhodomonas sp. AD133]|uniref:GNAT family N-acetyltransferase n=1 Tax=Arhodomonas sp. AD133 TaxID=3415009 RepID=UPI003EB9CDB1